MTLKGYILNLLSLMFMFLSTISTGQSLSYRDFIHNLNDLEEKGDFKKALGYLTEYKANFPNEYFELAKEEIYINEALQRYADNLFIFKEGHQKGYFYFIDVRIPKYKPYLEFSEFNTISADDLKLRNEAIQKSETIYEVELPKRFSDKREWPLCFIFHGGGSNLEKVRKHWHSLMLDSDYIKIYLQSYRHYDSNTYGWTSGDERADRELAEIFDSIRKSYPIDCSDIITAGISAGGTYAIDISIRGVIPVKSFIAFCPGIPGILNTENLSATKLSKIKGFIIGGEKDYYLAQQKQMTQALLKLQNPVKHLIICNMGHEYPPDEDIMIDEALEYLKRNEP